MQIRWYDFLVLPPVRHNPVLAAQILATLEASMSHMWHDIFPSHQRQSPYFTLILLLHHKATLPRNFALRQYVLRALSLALWGLAVRLYCHLTRMRPDSPLSAWFSFAVSDSATTCTCFDSSGFSTFCPFLGFLVFLPYLFNSFSNGCCGF